MRVFFVLMMSMILGTACQTDFCYSHADCGTGTCCDGACLPQTPIPFGLADCSSGCECADTVNGVLTQATCFRYSETSTTQCTHSCDGDYDCIAADGSQGRCLDSTDALLLTRLCVWEETP